MLSATMNSMNAVEEARSRTLFQNAVEGDHEAFWTLIEPYSGLIFSVAMGILNDPDRAQDILHDVYIQAWRSLGNLRNNSRFGAWLYTMTRNRCMDAIRRSSRASRAHRELAHHHSEVIPIYEVLIKREELKQMQEALHGLPEPFRIALNLKYMSGLKCREIAEVLDISLSAVKSRLFEARKLLAARIQEMDRKAHTAADGGVES